MVQSDTTTIHAPPPSSTLLCYFILQCTFEYNEAANGGAIASLLRVVLVVALGTFTDNGARDVSTFTTGVRNQVRFVR